MITYQQALARAEERLPLGEAIDDRKISQTSGYWVFAANTIRYLSTGDPMEAEVTDMFYLVSKTTGDVTMVAMLDAPAGITAKDNPESRWN